jgi:hypothetical protein
MVRAVGVMDRPPFAVHRCIADTSDMIYLYIMLSLWVSDLVDLSMIRIVGNH